MKVKLLVSRVGATFAQSRGDILDLPDAEALDLIKRGEAEAVPVKERAVSKQKAETR